MQQSQQDRQRQETYGRKTQDLPPWPAPRPAHLTSRPPGACSAEATRRLQKLPGAKRARAQQPGPRCLRDLGDPAAGHEKCGHRAVQLRQRPAHENYHLSSSRAGPGDLGHHVVLDDARQWDTPQQLARSNGDLRDIGLGGVLRPTSDRADDRRWVRQEPGRRATRSLDSGQQVAGREQAVAMARRVEKVCARFDRRQPDRPEKKRKPATSLAQAGPSRSSPDLAVQVR